MVVVVVEVVVDEVDVLEVVEEVDVLEVVEEVEVVDVVELTGQLMPAQIQFLQVPTEGPEEVPFLHVESSAHQPQLDLVSLVQLIHFVC
jgi:hypothetical protein